MPEHLSLEGRHVRLLALGPEHVDGLLAAATVDRSTFEYTPVPSDRAGMAAYVDAAMAKRESGHHEPFVTWSLAARRIVGSTRFYDLATWDWSSHSPGTDALRRRGRPDVAGIGYTWLEPSAQRSPVNTEAKLLMMTPRLRAVGGPGGADPDRRPQHAGPAGPSSAWAAPWTGSSGPSVRRPTAGCGTRPSTPCWTGSGPSTGSAWSTGWDR